MPELFSAEEKALIAQAAQIFRDKAKEILNQNGDEAAANDCLIIAIRLQAY